MGRVWGGNWMNGIHPCRDLDWWKAFRNHQCCVKKSREGVWGDFPGSPVVRTLCFPYRGTGSIPSQGTKILHTIQFSSVQSLSRVWLWPHGLQHTRLPFPSPTPGVCSNSCPSSRWCHPTISSSVIPFSSCLQSSPASGSFLMSQVFAKVDRWPKYWSFIISPSNEYSGLISFRIDWFDLLSVQGTLEFSPTPQFKTSILRHSAFFMVQLSNPYITTGKTISLTIWAFVGKVISLGSTENPPLRTAELGCIARFRTLDSQHSMNHWLKKGLPSIHQSQSSTFTGKKKGPEKGSFLPKFTQLAKQDLSPGCSSNSHWHILCPDSTCLSLWEKLKQR